MRVITLNVNGIRSAARKGFYDWLAEQNADVICLQELRVHEHQLKEAIFFPEGYHAYFNFAVKKGYSGTGIYTKYKPKQVMTQLGFESADTEGRYVAIDLGPVCIASLYLPSGTSGELRQGVKFDFLERYGHYLTQLANENKPYIICGDFNIAHKTIDLKNWRGNQKNSGFLPEERAWMDKLFDKMGFVDAFRAINSSPDQYTWWSNRGQAWSKNVGWRIDYHVTSHQLKPTILSANIYKESRYSDHAPLIVDYDIVI